MCEFVSWVEHKDQILFLTKKDLATKKGKELRVYLGDQFKYDIKGHGAIRKYYDLKASQGTDKECSDFSSLRNFPAVIVKAIKAGLFEGIAIERNLLTKPALAEYKKIEQQALAEYKKIEQQAFWKLFRIKKNRRIEWR